MEIPKKYKTNWIPRVAVGLLYLVLLSTWLLSGLSARFYTGTIVNDDARVAAFEVTEGDTTMSRDFAVTMKPGDTRDKDITVSVTNSSETAVSYTIAFEMTGNLPLTIAPVDAGKSDATTGETSEEAEDDATAPLIQESGNLIWHTSTPDMPDSQKEYSFQLKWDEGQNGYQYAEGIEGVTVEITAVQED